MDLNKLGAYKMDNKARMIELKRKNAITNMCKEWREHSIDISIDDYLDVYQTLQLQEGIIVELDKLDRNNKSLICSESNVVLEFMKYLKKKIHKECKYIFFEAGATKIGALKLSGKDILEKSDFVIQKSEFFDGGCSIFFCSYSMDNGICLWRGEYDSRIYVW